MKKNRASFFNEQIDYASYNTNQYNNQYQNPSVMQSANAPQASMMPMMPNIGAQSSFYAGMPPIAGQNNISPILGQNEDIESRLAKIERQINRLDHRLSKLEGQNTITTNDLDSNINDMYMI